MSKPRVETLLRQPVAEPPPAAGTLPCEPDGPQSQGSDGQPGAAPCQAAAPPPGEGQSRGLPAAMTQSLGFLAHQLAARTRASFMAVLGKHGLHPRHYLLMLVLRDEGAHAQQSLGARAGLDRTTTMQAAQTLEAAGLLTRRDDPKDRRVYRLDLTPAGRRLVSSLETRIRRADQELLAPLSAEQRAQLYALLGTLLGGDGGGAATDC